MVFQKLVELFIYIFDKCILILPVSTWIDIIEHYWFLDFSIKNALKYHLFLKRYNFPLFWINYFNSNIRPVLTWILIDNLFVRILLVVVYKRSACNNIQIVQLNMSNVATHFIFTYIFLFWKDMGWLLLNHVDS